MGHSPVHDPPIIRQKFLQIYLYIYLIKNCTSLPGSNPKQKLQPYMNNSSLQAFSVIGWIINYHLLGGCIYTHVLTGQLFDYLSWSKWNIWCKTSIFDVVHQYLTSAKIWLVNCFRNTMNHQLMKIVATAKIVRKWQCNNEYDFEWPMHLLHKFT